MPTYKSINSAKVTDDDTYQNQRSSDPIKYGEMLVRMQGEGRTQQEIADEISCNRQMVGRYQRIGKWPAEVKHFVRANREKVTNTKILTLASRPLSDKEVLAELKGMVEVQDKVPGELMPFPTVNGFNELISKLEAIERRLHNLETQREPVELNRSTAGAFPSIANPAISPEFAWIDLFRTAAKPCSVLLMICITVLTTYLAYQGVVFFSAIDSKPVSAISSALISELVPFLTAACFALATRWTHRGIALAMLLASIVGLGVFMHNSISTQLTQSSGQYKRLVKSRDLALEAITAHTSVLVTLPESHISKRQETTSKISLERENLAKIDRDLAALELRGESGGTDLNYAVWIRIAAMLLNAYLIHLFFSGFRLSAPNADVGPRLRKRRL